MPANERRALRGRRDRSEIEFEEWLQQVTERLDPLMAWLGVLFALVVGFELAVELSPAGSQALSLAGWLIWGSFVMEFAAKLWLAPRRGRYLRRHWLQALALALPTLRLLRLARLLRLGRALPVARVLSSSYRSAATARRVFQSRLAYLGGVSSVAAFALAELVYLFERGRSADQAFSSFGDALLWAAGVIIALHADPVPDSVSGRLAMLAGFAFGLVIVASLAATIGALLIDEQRRTAQPPSGNDEQPPGGVPGETSGSQDPELNS